LAGAEEIKRLDDLYQERLKMQDPFLRDALVQSAVVYLYTINGSRFSKTDTEAERKIAMERVPIPILRINRGDAIIQKDEVITDEKYQALLRHKRARFAEKIERIVAIFVEQAVLTGLLVYFAVRFALRRVSDVSSNLIIFLTVWAFAGVLLVLEGFWANGVDYNEVTHYFGSWVPIGAFAVLLAIIFGDSLAIPIAVYLAFLVFLASKNDGNSLIITAGVGVIGAILGGRISKRVHFITTAVSLALMGMVLTTACYLYGDRAIFATLSSKDFFSQNFRDALRISFFSGISTVLVIALLPVYETLFNIPTRFRLAELADPTNPLLKEMFRKAPSTWQHTLMVAALVEKACERLGLNTTLARTGIYYHDIGKMKNAGFFVENQHLIPRPENIDLENPQKAAKVIIDHVLDGIEMAKAARLPREVLAFIPEHHGTSTMSFFYHKALEKMKRRVRREDFRYPGPLPQSKETAIAMIADSLEAASRSLEEFTSAAVDGLIAKIISLKLAENQLDESGLTVGDLSVIQRAFHDVLMSSYHFRPKYPDKKKTDKLEADRRPKKGSAAKKRAGRAP
ncbi:MAG: HDIG domain-containing protein, partial [Spirochaetia bacterium]|nr:HDIG domain-containing protein [Spirochaetia bacterium]